MRNLIIFGLLVCLCKAESEEELTWDLYLIYSTISTLLVLFAGAMSGLTVGMMSLGDLELEMKIVAGTPEEQVQAKRVLPVVNKHHQLLVTLLLANAVAMEALPIFLDKMFPSWAAIIISTTLVLFFGEVIPQALLIGPNQLQIASSLVPLVKFVMCIFYPLAKPIAILLDVVLGHHMTTRYNDADLKTLVDLHVQSELQQHLEATSQQRHGLMPWQAKIIHGAIDLKDAEVSRFMTSSKHMYCLSEDTVLNFELLDDLLHSGYSRVPIYRGKRSSITGILHVKKLITVNPEQSLTIRSSGVELREPLKVNPDTNLLDLLSMFKMGKGHFALVIDPNFTEDIQGFITLEDVIEELVRGDILDEDDYDRACRKLAHKEVLKDYLTRYGNSFRGISRRNTTFNDRLKKLHSLGENNVYMRLED